jgi:M6 family metalloprotease-like protein
MVFTIGLIMMSCDAFTIQTTTDVSTNDIETSQNIDSTTTDPLTNEVTTVEMTEDFPTVDEITTIELSTEVSTTIEPTTVLVTTEVPTTEALTTAMPTTVVPTTMTPTTEVPTTEVPTTEVPTTEVPTTEVPTTVEATTDLYEPFVPTGYSLLQDELDAVGIPSTGDVKILVFAVDFPDLPADASSPSVSDITTAFNGESTDLEYESLNSYFQIVSNGTLNIQADVFGYYTTSETSNYYQQQNGSSYVESDIIYEVLSYYDDDIDYSEYDQNNDGMIDGVYIIYNHEIDSDSDLWWAYQWNYAYYDEFDGMGVDFFTWASNEFMYEDGETINARTFIHETGHMMGLDDYYDYSYEDSYNNGGLGTYMMDYSIGDEDPLSKLLLGWIQPIVIETSTTIQIAPHLENGDVLLIIDEWQDTIFDEYLLVTYFTPDGLNASDTGRIFTDPGINIFHVSAQIDNGYDPNSYYYTIFNYNNTDTIHKLIDIVEADMNESIEAYEVVENSDLFQVGDILNQNVYMNYEWYTGEPLGFIVSIDSITVDQATITVIFE